MVRAVDGAGPAPDAPRRLADGIYGLASTAPDLGRPADCRLDVERHHPLGQNGKLPTQLGLYRNQAEYVLTATHGGYDKSVRLCPPGVVREPIRTKDKLHLTGKPVPLMEHLMTILPSGSRILDPFAGSGTTLVAARNKGHTAVGIELSSDYHRIATDRLGMVLTA